MLKRNDNDEQKRLLLATALTTILIVGWIKWYGTKTISPSELQEAKRQEQSLNKSDDLKTKNENSILKEDVIKNAPKESKEEKLEEKRLKIETELLEGSINLRGLVLDDLVLKKYKTEIGSNDNVRLLDKFNNKDAYFITIGWESSDMEVPTKNTLWKANKNILKVGEPVILTYKDFQVILSVDENYMFSIEQKYKNKTKNNVILKVKNSISKKQTAQPEMSAHNGFIGVANNSLQEISYDGIVKKELNFSKVNWGGWTSKYWLVSLINSDNYNVKTSFNDNLYIATFESANTELAPTKELIATNHLFAGAKIVELLDEYQDKYQMQLFDRAIDFGWYYFLTRPFYMILKGFYYFIGNFGLSILFLTFIAKWVMYPVTKKSYMSAARIKKIKPKIDVIKARNKDNKVAIQKETLELYKRENISPLSGCLPTLIQIPIFFSLYKVFVISIDMRQAPFFGYIKDLSVKDPTTIWNLFGLLPYNVNFLQIGLLPCLMALTTWLQQKISGDASDSSEMATATKLMPFMFLFIFASMPMGLLVYWTFSNILSIIQQIIIERKMK